MTYKITHDISYLNQVISLYLEAFTSGESQQYIEEEALEGYILDLLKTGTAVVSLDKEEITGCLLGTTLAKDKNFPAEILKDFIPYECAYIAEVMVSKNHRGKGIGNELIVKYIKTLQSKGTKEVLIRVWDKNDIALHLYKKLGFKEIASITQEKRTVDNLSTFEMRKLYLHKKLN